MPDTPDDLRALRDAITPGPWIVDLPHNCDVVGGSFTEMRNKERVA